MNDGETLLSRLSCGDRSDMIQFVDRCKESIKKSLSLPDLPDFNPRSFFLALQPDSGLLANAKFYCEIFDECFLHMSKDQRDDYHYNHARETAAKDLRVVFAALAFKCRFASEDFDSVVLTAMDLHGRWPEESFVAPLNPTLGEFVPRKVSNLSGLNHYRAGLLSAVMPTCVAIVASAVQNMMEEKIKQLRAT